MCKLKPKQNRKTTKRRPPTATRLPLICMAPGNWPLDLTAVCTPSLLRLRLKSGWALPVCWIFNFSIVLKDGTHSVLHLWPLAVAYFRAHANVTLLCHTHTHSHTLEVATPQFFFPFVSLFLCLSGLVAIWNDFNRMRRPVCPVHFGFGLLRLTFSANRKQHAQTVAATATTTATKTTTTTATTTPEVAPGNQQEQQQQQFHLQHKQNVSYPMFDFLYLFYSRAVTGQK